MKPYATNIVTFRVLLAGYEQARQRFHVAALSRDAGRTFAPLFEALNWAVVLDDQARQHWVPFVLPMATHEWRWRRLADLPPARALQGRRAAEAAAEAEADYDRLLAGQPARAVLGQLSTPFNFLADVLEPTIAEAAPEG